MASSLANVGLPLSRSAALLLLSPGSFSFVVLDNKRRVTATREAAGAGMGVFVRCVYSASEAIRTRPLGRRLKH